jgi:hypothetical protein
VIAHGVGATPEIVDLEVLVYCESEREGVLVTREGGALANFVTVHEATVLSDDENDLTSGRGNAEIWNLERVPEGGLTGEDSERGVCLPGGSFTTDLVACIRLLDGVPPTMLPVVTVDPSDLRYFECAKGASKNFGVPARAYIGTSAHMHNINMRSINMAVHSCRGHAGDFSAVKVGDRRFGAFSETAEAIARQGVGLCLRAPRITPKLWEGLQFVSRLETVEARSHPEEKKFLLDTKALVQVAREATRPGPDPGTPEHETNRINAVEGMASLFARMANETRRDATRDTGGDAAGGGGP